MPGLAWMSADQFLDRLRRQRRMEREQRRRLDRQRDRFEILDRIERNLIVQGGIDGERRGGKQNGVAIGRRLRRAGHADIAAAAADVLDIELLAKLIGQLQRDQASDDVGRTARRVRNDHAHRSVGIALGHGVRHRREADANDRCDMQHPTAKAFMAFPSDAIDAPEPAARTFATLQSR